MFTYIYIYNRNDADNGTAVGVYCLVMVGRGRGKWWRKFDTKNAETPTPHPYLRGPVRVRYEAKVNRFKRIKYISVFKV